MHEQPETEAGPAVGAEMGVAVVLELELVAAFSTVQALMNSTVAVMAVVGKEGLEADVLETLVPYLAVSGLSALGVVPVLVVAPVVSPLLLMLTG